MSKSSGQSLWNRIIPGILVAATGVGAGDLVTASLAGSEVGLVLLWAALVGALLKWVLNEGLARWQMATGTTLIQGWVQKLGGWIEWAFMIYFFLWTYSVGGALINACGVAGAGLFPVSDPHTSKIFWGIIHSLAGLLLVWFGGFKVFQYAMSFFIVIMVIAVPLTVVLVGPDLSEILSGLFVPRIPRGSVGWLLGVIGGVGGTVTLMSYSYWIREKKRAGAEGVKACRLDLSVGYALTALFGVSMIIIGSRITVTGKGATVALLLADQLAAVFGPAGRLFFLLRFWGAVFSSLLGVWQGVPYIFADFLQLRRGKGNGSASGGDLSRTKAYRIYLIILAVVPIQLLWFNVQQVQLIYAVLGALFMPLLALTLLLLNNRRDWVGRRFKNGRLTNGLLLITMLFFLYLGAREILGRLVQI
jgi:Mn2+/Fe2+ NRAMP family transporter